MIAITVSNESQQAEFQHQSGPVVLGRSPVIIAVRQGLHSGAGQCALVNRTPRFARLSMLGVLISERPPRQPIQS